MSNGALRTLLLRGVLLFGVALGVSSLGCSSIGRGGVSAATAASESSDEEDTDLAPGGDTTQVADATLPGQQEVTWTDNGIPIRQLTGPGKPQEMKVPESHPKKPKMPAPTQR